MLPQQNKTTGHCANEIGSTMLTMYEEQTKNRRKARGVKNSNNQQTFFLDLLPGKIRDTKIIMISVYVFNIPGRPQRYGGS
jgi:hypothetical protein